MTRALKTAQDRAELSLELRVPISCSSDIIRARQKGRELAQKLGFVDAEVTLITSAISEIARNIVDYAQSGEMLMGPAQQGIKHGLVLVARDEGPGIANIAQVMQYGCPTQQRLGVGLPGAKWLMDDFEITSKPGEGTTVVMKKWLNQ